MEARGVAKPLTMHDTGRFPLLSLNEELSSPDVSRAKVKKHWFTLLLDNTVVIQRLEAQKLFENYLGEQECSLELTWIRR